MRILDSCGGGPSGKTLISLPGVGTKTANVVRAELFKIPEIAVDTHVFRIGKDSVLRFIMKKNKIT